MPFSRFPLSNDTAQTLLRSLTILQSLGESIPAGGILKTIAGIGITLLEVVETARVNKAECLDIAERAARNILTINSQLTLCEHMSEDLRSRLEVYRDMLAGVASSVERLCAISKTQRALNVVSIQEATRECREKLSEAYQTYIFRSSIATDRKLNVVMRGLNTLCSNDKSLISRPGEPDEIPVRLIAFGNELSRDEKKTYILRVESGELQDPMGFPKAVVLRRFEAKLGMEDQSQSLEDFQREVEIRGDLL
ncbi:hypothetical protein SISSUDRAFT_1037955 [Sistotremastrum suecicum HHB10207 ss-3]|uniref:Fungal N-terminal domain-containing protein n=1 Tax=Sistotremastrum suecicum HHB10207 ss-3 TaxID=1314776 RepID=A0A165XEG5_9AGAM|nr:hypothetical protein SISSUDRAFT_1037955 [Sistotremastrum suecicum HHB10207 ss-3]